MIASFQANKFNNSLFCFLSRAFFQFANNVCKGLNSDSREKCKMSLDAE